MCDQREQPTQAEFHENSETALAEKVAFLGRPDSYVPVPEGVIARETHMSWVFMAGDRVYKLKKPVRFSYLDFSTLERRARACRAEYSLNRRLAPDVYLGVVPLTATSAGYAIGGNGEVTDWLVVMRRLEEAETLEAMLPDHKITPIKVERLIETLRAFYAHAPRIMLYPESYLVSLHSAFVEDRHILLNAAFNLPLGEIDRIADTQLRFIKERAKTITDRVHARHIVDAHGDLRPEHIWLSDPFPIIDCLEFDPRLRALDALDEIAFLHLECERLGGRWIGERIRQRLAHTLRDDPKSGLFLFYRIGRAMLRARLSIAHLIDPHPRTPEKWPLQTRAYLRLAQADAKRLQRLLDH